MSALLKPAPMSRIAVIGLKKYRQQIISILHEMNVIQLEPLSKEADSFLMIEHESDLHREISDQLLRIRGLINTLPPTTIHRKTSFSSFDELIKSIKSIDIDGQIASLEREKENLLTEMKEAENNIKLLEEFSFFPEDLRILNLSFARSYFGRVASEKLDHLKLTWNQMTYLLYYILRKRKNSLILFSLFLHIYLQIYLPQRSIYMVFI